MKQYTSDKVLRILIWILVVVIIGGIAMVIIFGITDYSIAKKKCLPLKQNQDCSYEICMADEYGSGVNIDRMEKCVIRTLNQGRGEE